METPGDAPEFSARPLPDDVTVLATLALAEGTSIPEWEYQLRIRDRRGERVMPIERRPYSLGRAADNTIVIDDPAVEEHHFRAWGGRLGLWYVPIEERFPQGNAQAIAGLCRNETLRLGEAEVRVECLQIEVPPEGDFRGMVGRSPAMLALYEAIRLAAPSPLAVLIRGETGTGKELAARALHELSPRAQGPYVTVNCSALTASLVESELFGSEKGAYTGATQARQGLFETAHHGTLFLDEIGELPLDLQPKLLRVLQSGELRRVGSSQTRKVDVRVVAATHLDVESAMEVGRFRPDLYFRLCGFRLAMPPLAERAGDLLRLTRYFLRQHGPVGETVTLSDEAVFKLYRHRFRGQVRDLEITLQRALALRNGAPVIEAEHLQFEGPPDEAMATDAVATTPVSPSADDDHWLWLPGKTKAQLVAEATTKAWRRHGGNVAEAAAELGVHRNSIRNRRE